MPGTVLSTTQEVRDYVQAGAIARGIDPRIADSIVRHEGGYDPSRWTSPGDVTQGTSWGPFQLNYLTGSLGSLFTLATGIRLGADNVQDTWQRQVDWTLDYLARIKDNKSAIQSQWHGVRDNAEGRRELDVIFATPGVDPITPPLPPKPGDPVNSNPVTLDFGAGVLHILALVLIGTLGAALVIAGIGLLGAPAVKKLA